MKNVARIVSAEQVFEEVGRVISVEGRGARVRTNSGDYAAKRAASCLLEPAVDDVVLLALTPTGTNYVLAVLEREEGAKATMKLDGDLELQLPKGRFTVAAQDGIDLLSSREVAVTSESVKVTAREGSAVLERLSLLGDVVRAEVGKVKLLASTLDSIVERVSLKAKNVYRHVAETDQLRAERIDHSAKCTMSLHAGNAIVTAEELVKVDGEQIHLG